MQLYELVNATDDERYFTLGIWLTLEDAVAAVGDDPTKLMDCDDDSAVVEIRERAVGWSGTGQVVFTRKWVRDFDTGKWAAADRDCSDG